MKCHKHLLDSSLTADKFASNLYLSEKLNLIVESNGLDEMNNIVTQYNSLKNGPFYQKFQDRTEERNYVAIMENYIKLKEQISNQNEQLCDKVIKEQLLGTVVENFANFVETFCNWKNDIEERFIEMEKFLFNIENKNK